MSVAHRVRYGALTLVLVLASARLVAGQPLGPFTWQLQPFCNVLTLTATPANGVFLLSGFDDQCGGPTRAAADGVAFVNPDSTIGIGVSIVTNRGTAVVIDASISLTTLSGTWRDGSYLTGNFAFGASTGGEERYEYDQFLFNAGFQGFPGAAVLVSMNGTREAPQPPTAGLVLATFAGGGFVNGFAKVAATIQVRASEAWLPSATGTSLSFSTTPNATNDDVRRMTIADDGNVGIGTIDPAEKLDVNGDVRVGTAGTNGCLKNNNGGGITGMCSSDRRFKRDITPFAAGLDAVAALRPVHYYWRSAEFPQKGFGSERGYGLIAQDVAEVLPEVVSTDEDGYQAIDYAKLPLLAIQAIRELKDKNDALERRLAAIEAAMKYERK